MPIININMLEGRTLEQKRDLADKVTKAVCEALDAPADSVRIILSDMPKTNYSVAGELVVDRKK